jgi:hypothetical protein
MESFVARHVLVILMHNGDMDAHSPNDHGGVGGGFTLENEQRIEREEFGEREANGGTLGAIVEGGGILCMNRRQTWTVAIYLVRFCLTQLYTLMNACFCNAHADPIQHSTVDNYTRVDVQ